MRFFISLMLIGMTGCAAAAPAPKTAIDEESLRARARCRMAAAMYVDLFEDPVRWTMIYRNCMRSGGQPR